MKSVTVHDREKKTKRKSSLLFLTENKKYGISLGRPYDLQLPSIQHSPYSFPSNASLRWRWYSCFYLSVNCSSVFANDIIPFVLILDFDLNKTTKGTKAVLLSSMSTQKIYCHLDISYLALQYLLLEPISGYYFQRMMSLAMRLWRKGCWSKQQRNSLHYALCPSQAEMKSKVLQTVIIYISIK